MSAANVEKLPPESRIWVFGAEKAFDTDQLSALEAQLDDFVQDWNSHKKEVTGGWMMRYNRFVIVAVDESATAVSGCSVDSLMRRFKEFEASHGVNLLDNNGKIFFREGEDIRCATREDFADLVTEGIVGEATVVFDNTIRKLGDLTAGRWEVPMKDSWHGKVFGTMIEM